jgi:hypothetical protein
MGTGVAICQASALGRRRMNPAPGTPNLLKQVINRGRSSHPQMRIRHARESRALTHFNGFFVPGEGSTDAVL